MLRRFHIEMMHLALDESFDPRALERVIESNLYQDRLLGLIGHDEYHFDNSAFEKSYAYVEEQRAQTLSSLNSQKVTSAWSAFGRMTHAVQDFYAHSNYVELWLARQREGVPPHEVESMDKDLLYSPSLRSGKVYVLEVLTLVAPLKPLVMSILPRDAHAWVNLDAPENGPNFPYAFQAAVKRTRIEFEKTTRDLPADLLALFVGR
jgi:hypothetical protein